MESAERYPFTQADGGTGNAALLPLLPVELTLQGRSVSVAGLLDTGASINVLPYDLGVRLGANWLHQTIPLHLTGNLARFEARALLLDVVVGELGPVKLAFAWTRSDEAPLILGQVNFFMEFDVCFYRHRQFFEVRPKSVGI